MGIDKTNAMNSHSTPDNITTQQPDTSDSTTRPSFGNNAGSTAGNISDQDVIVDKRAQSDLNRNKDSTTSYSSTLQGTDQNKHIADTYVCY